MNFHPLPHTVTADEITELRAIGFEFYIDMGTVEEFINLYFPNFNPGVFLVEIDKILTPLCTAVIYRQLFFKTLNGPELTINFFTENYKEDEGLALSRTFSIVNQKPVVYHHLFKLPRGKRRLGFSKVVFQLLLQQYINIGVTKINVHAALADGGYVWAKHFFTATQKDEISEILETAKKRLGVLEFSMVKRIFDN